jgi:hypothetical protein
MRLLQPLGPWMDNCNKLRSWKYIQFGNDIVDTHSQPYKYYAITRAQIFHPIVLPPVSTPVIPNNIFDNTIICNPPDEMQIIPFLTHSEICANIPLHINGTIHNNEIDIHTKIIIASDGSLNRGQCTFGGLIATEQNSLVELKGITPKQFEPTSLTSEAYGCFFTLQYLSANLNNTFYNNDITIILDNTSLIQSINNAKYHSPSPTQCLSPEHDTIYELNPTTPFYRQNSSSTP